MFLSHIDVSLPLSPPSSFSKINEDLKKKSFVSDPEVLCVLPASMTQGQDGLLLLRRVNSHPPNVHDVTSLPLFSSPCKQY